MCVSISTGPRFLEQIFCLEVKQGIEGPKQINISAVVKILISLCRLSRDFPLCLVCYFVLRLFDSFIVCLYAHGKIYNVVG